MAVYGVTMLVGGIGALSGKAAVKRGAAWLMAAGLLVNAGMLAYLWVELGRPPFKTLYETMLLYPLCIAVVTLALVWVHGLLLLTPFSAAGAIICLLYAYLRPDLELVLLPPALQSAWFVPHVVTYFIAYAGLFVSFVLAGLTLVKGWGKPQIAEVVSEPESAIPLDDATYKAAAFGFAALTLGLAMGAAWGKSAWGDYWQWDPKENWAFITWLAYLCYLHLRLLREWRGRKVLWLNLACFAAVIFTYLGMHLLPSAEGSLHVYQ
jgi:cytochrome c-type biogenesis protein CcsB